MAESDDFESRLDALGTTRGEAEEEYFRLLRELEARVAAARDAAGAAGTLAADYVPGERWSPTEAPPVPAAVRERERVEPPPAIGWPRGRGWLRRRLNGLVRWLWRDHLQALDERHEGIAAACSALATEIVDVRAQLERVRGELAAAYPGLHETVQALGRRQAETEPAMHARVETVREAVDRMGEALDAIAGLSEQQRLLGDAKDAENLVRATGGPMRHTGLLLDELARQQEALLSELVGKRQELEELVAKARGET